MENTTNEHERQSPASGATAGSAARPTTRNRAFLSAWDKGFEAARAGKPARANPYPDYTTDRGSVTFSRAFRRYWHMGWQAGVE